MSASTPPAPPRWRVRFQLYLTAVLALLALVAGSAVSWLNYRSASSQLMGHRGSACQALRQRHHVLQVGDFFAL